MAAPYRLRASRPVAPGSAAALLGAPLRTFHQAGHRPSVWAAAPFVLVLAFVVWQLQQGQLARMFNSSFSAFAVCAMLVLAAGLILRTAVAGGGEAVRVHTGGLLDLRIGPRAVRWDEVLSLTAVASADGSGVLRHLLRTSDGATLSLGRSIAEVDELVDEIRARMVERDAPDLGRRIEGGEVVPFGAMAASAQGVALGPRVVAWDEVQDVDADGGAVVVRGRDGQSLLRAPLDQVPNAFLLAELAHARRTRGQ